MTELVSPARTRVLLGLLHVHERDGRATVRSLADETGRSINPTHRHLRRLRDAGLVAWTPGSAGTLRPLVTPVPFGEAP